MVTNHFIDRWKERIEERGVPKDLRKELMIRSYKVVEKNRGQDEMVCLIDFNEHGFDFYENELWVIIRDKTLITMFRRNTHSPKRLNGSRVESIGYVWKW